FRRASSGNLPNSARVGPLRPESMYTYVQFDRVYCVHSNRRLKIESTSPVLRFLTVMICQVPMNLSWSMPARGSARADDNTSSAKGRARARTLRACHATSRRMVGTAYRLMSDLPIARVHAENATSRSHWPALALAYRPLG